MPLTSRDRAAPRCRSALLLILINGVLLALALAAFELGLRLFEPPSSVRYSVYPPGQITTVKVDPRVTSGVHGDAEYEVNEVGTRGPMPSAGDDVRVVAIGGSTTECFVLSLEESWPFLLGSLLEDRSGRSVWVGNIARAGRSSRQHYFDAKYVIPQFGRVDAAVLLAGINDQFHRMTQGREFETVDVVALDAAGEYIATALHVTEPAQDWLEGIHLLRLSRRALESFQLLDPKQREIRRLLSHTLPDFYVQSRAMRAARGETIEALPPMEEALAEFQRNMSLTLALLRQRQARPILVTQPSLWRVGIPPEEERLLWLGSADGWPPNRESAPYYSAGAMAAMLEMYNEVIRRLAASEGAVLVDLDALLSGDRTALYDDIHFTESGSSRTAAAIADKILADGLLERRRRRAD